MKKSKHISHRPKGIMNRISPKIGRIDVCRYCGVGIEYKLAYLNSLVWCLYWGEIERGKCKHTKQAV